MLGLFILNNDAGNIEIFPIGSKYFGAFLKKIPENELFSLLLCYLCRQINNND